MKIGELAQQAGVGVETVRFYERQGLLATPQRPESGYREYSADDLSRLRFIRNAKELGFSLPETQDLLSLRSEAAAPCSATRRRIEAKLIEIRRKIQALEQLQGALETFASSCDAKGESTTCPLLEALQRGEGPLAPSTPPLPSSCSEE